MAFAILPRRSGNSRACLKRNAYGLTAREKKIVAAVLSGHGNQGIAETLNISRHTVKNHLTAIFKKLGVSSRLELGLFAAKHFVVDEDSRTLHWNTPAPLERVRRESTKPKTHPRRRRRPHGS